MSDGWKFEEVTWHKMESTLRKCHVPEEVVQAIKRDADANYKRRVKLVNFAGDQSFLESSVILSSADASSGFSAWVSPEGRVYWLPPGVGHTLFVCNNPEIFGVSPDLALKYKTVTQEDMLELVTTSIHGELYRNGWIRIRNYFKHFFITCKDAHFAVRVLKSWAEEVLNTGKLDASTMVSIMGDTTSKSIDTFLGELLVSRSSVKKLGTRKQI